VPVGEFAALTPGGKTPVSADGKVAPVEGPPAQIAEGVLQRVAVYRVLQAHRNHGFDPASVFLSAH